MEKRRTFPMLGIGIAAAFLVILAVAAASFFAGTVVARRSVAPQEPLDGATPRSELVRRVTRLPGVTSAVEGRSGVERQLFVVVEMRDWGAEEREAFLEKLLEAVGGELPLERIVVVSRKGGEVLPWGVSEGLGVKGEEGR